MRGAIACSLLLAACGGDAVTATSAPRPAVGEEFVLAPGQSADVTDAGWRVTFRSVPEDSRCPVDVNCVWEGDAVAEVSLRASGAPERTVRLHTRVAAEREEKVGELYLRLVALAPVRRADTPVRPEDYRATFVASRTPLSAAPQP